uniref:FtsK/SpoIIIE domain-containing protein n=1 Tax=Candidatus Electrothrix sp. TaxID=2170559 RepID=UPI004055C84F
MADIYTSKKDEEVISRVLRHGLKLSGNKWKVLRIALAKSLQIDTEPDDSLDRVPTDGKKEYNLQQVTGKGKESTLKTQDWDAACRAMLGVYHKQDFFSDEAGYRKHLQRHIRRGLREIDVSWKSGSDFHAWLSHEFFSNLQSAPVEVTEHHDQLVAAFSEIGIQAEISEVSTGPRLIRYKIYLADINELDRLKRGGLEKLANLLGVQQQGVIQGKSDEPKTIYLSIPRPRDSWNYAAGKDLRQWVETFLPENYKLPVWIGTDVVDQPYFFDLADTPHLFVAGTTGSGKSVCLHGVIISLLERMAATPQKIQFALIDPKEVELFVYESLPNLFMDKVFGEDVAEVMELLRHLIEEMNERNALFRSIGVTNIDEAMSKGEELPRIVVVIEELADLVMESKEVQNDIVRLAQKARSAGIHLVLATQRPDSQVFSGLLRSNIPSRIALSVQKSTESKIILDDVGAEKLLGSGDMLVKLNSEAVPKRIHGVFVNRDDSMQAIKHFTKALRQ